MNRTRIVALQLALACLLMAGLARRAHAVAETHRLNLVFSAIPTQIKAQDYNDRLDYFNRRYVEPAGVKGLEEINFGWLFEAEVRYFVKQSVAITAGVGQLRTHSDREFLPAIQFDVQLRAEMLSVPVHVGGAYYLKPYNQGDFQARAFFGGGFTSVVYNRARLQQVTSGVDVNGNTFTTTTKVTGLGDAPGYYLEGGAHMFFASRFSVILGLTYRSSMLRDPHGEVQVNAQTFPVEHMSSLPQDVPLGGLKAFDTSGIGARMGLSIGF